MNKIVRTKTKALGGVTPDEQEKLKAHTAKWIANAMSTEPVNPTLLTEAIRSLYAAANLKEPRIVIVSSPLVMAFAGGFAAAIWWARKNNAKVLNNSLATYAATYDATDAATRDATDAATREATDAATYEATYAATDEATYAATRDATRAAKFFRLSKQLSAEFGVSHSLMLSCAQSWWRMYQGGNMWSAWDSYVSAFRDVLGLVLPEHEKYRAWEACATEGGFRIMHEEFCIVSDRPEILSVDEQNRPHNETGPSHRWRDGWSLYHWHGVKVPAHWIEDRANLDPKEVIAADNVELRAAGAAICGWPKMLSVLKSKIINDSGSDDIGQLIELTLPGLDEPGRFLKAKCPRNGFIVEGVPRVSDIDGLPIETALAAQAWRVGDPLSEYEHPAIRT